MESDMPIELIAARLWSGTKWHYPNAERMVEENKRLRAELAALKAKDDPLAEMWRELSEYQPQADRNGHGESWRRMCAERTEEAARAAARAATVARAAWAAWAAWAASERTAWAAGQSIAAIRRAKEAKP